ncbi:hypothetical protein HYT24_00355 [Candidatus Pacearchaeota archaeon]|nr:hypothetical protein [Candidatus Pacearchaeota archaeon]
MELKGVKKFLEELYPNNLVFDPHFYKRTSERPISEGMARGFLSQLNKLEKIEKGKGERFKLWFKMSRKYSLVLIAEINDTTKVLKVISAWNTDRKWQDKLKQ